MKTRHFAMTADGPVVVLELHKRLSSLADSALLDEISAALDDLPKDGPPLAGVVVDFTDVEYFGSIMLEALRMISKRAQDAGGRLTLCGLNPVCREILSISKFDTLWPVHDSRAAAVGSLQA